MPYESKFDVRHPLPGDQELATIIRDARPAMIDGKVLVSAMGPSPLEIPEAKRVYCACGKSWQEQAGWDAQGLFEDLPDGNAICHNLAPDHCFRTEEERTTRPLGKKRFIAYGRRLSLNDEAHHEFVESWPPRVLIDFRSAMERHNGTQSQIFDNCALCGHEHRVWLTRDTIWRLVPHEWRKKRLCVECFKMLSAKKINIPDGPPQKTEAA